MCSFFSLSLFSSADYSDLSHFHFSPQVNLQLLLLLLLSQNLSEFFDESESHILYVYTVISTNDIIKLTTYKQAVKSLLCDKWKKTMKNEIQSLKNNNMWDIVNVLLNQHIFKEHWVYKVKCDTYGQVSHYKTHWVVKSYKQQYDIDYNQIFVSVVKSQTYKTLFALVTHYDLKVN